MSKKDLQFIDQALKRPWMFWVYFWKWPRIVRQACAEYDLLAKERDVAKEAHEQAVRANKIVRDWIHVTHRLDMTADMRAIWTAGKRLSALLLFLGLTLSASAQLPPILRNQWTTNANPLALKVISTNGVHAATNVWELDFTNTATVTVSAVSNANRVMVSFIGSASSTNWWTNFSLPTIQGGLVHGIADTNPIASSTKLAVNYLTNTWGDPGTLISIGYRAGGTNDGYSSAPVLNLTDFAGENQVLQESFEIVNIGVAAGAGQVLTNSDVIFNLGLSAGQSQKLTNTTLVDNYGSAAGQLQVSFEGDNLFNLGGNAGKAQSISNSGNVFNLGDDSGLSQIVRAGIGVWNIGNSAGSGQTINTATEVYNFGQAGANQIVNNSARIYRLGYASGSLSRLTNCTDVYFFGSFSGTNLPLTGVTNAMVFGNLLGATPVNQEFWFGNTNNVYRFPGNIGTIRGLTYSWPTAHASGVLTDDGSGNLSWSASSGGGGIASVYTNNVLAGGPGLTELGFTNSSTVRVAATTNAGRSTVSYDTRTNDAGVFVVQGTTDNGLYVAQSTAIGAGSIRLGFTSPKLGLERPGAGHFIHYSTSSGDTTVDAVFGGAKVNLAIGGTTKWQVANAGHFLATTDNTVDIGASGATRPRNVFIAGNMVVGGGITNDTLTASTVLAADSTKEIVSIANGAGVLTNDGAGVTGWKPLSDFGSGSSSLTNALLHAGPTNGSVDALILTAGNGVTLTTSGTNRVLAVSNNIIAGSGFWTNFSFPGFDQPVVGIRDVNPIVSVASFGANFVDANGGNGGVVDIGYQSGSSGQGFSSSFIVNLGDFAGEAQSLSNCISIANIGLLSGQSQSLHESFIINNYGNSSGSESAITNSSRLFNMGLYAGKSIKGIALDQIFNFGFYSGALLKASNVVGIGNFGIYASGGETSAEASSITNSQSLFNFGYATGQKQVALNSTSIYNYGTFAGSNQVANGTSRYYTYGAYSGAASQVTNSADIYGFGTYSFRDAHINDSTNLFGSGIDTFEHALLTNSHNITAIGFETLENAKLTNSIDIIAIGNRVGLSGDGLTDIIILGNDVSSALSHQVVLGAADQTNLIQGSLQVTSGTLGAGKVLTDVNGDGFATWQTASSGSGIGSIYTNNVLAGGPGLTELEFTNTATVTWAATTNAGRVTMSATSVGGGSGIATNDGTGWNTTFLTQTNHNQIVFTNGSKIGATAINTLTLTNANLMFSADNTFDVGASGANRPRDIHVGRNLIVNGISTSLQVPNGHVYIGQDQIYYVASRLSIASPSAGVMRIANEGVTDFNRIQFGGTTAAFPGLAKTNGHLVVVDATRANSTNSLFFGNTVDTTASTGMTMNRQTGRVRLSAGNQTYLVTNNLATANSIVTATINSDDTTAVSVKAIPTAGLITLKANAATTANTDISFFISSP